MVVSLFPYAINVRWTEHFSNKELNIPSISSIIQARRFRFVGHCIRSNQPVSKLILWEKPGKYLRRGGWKIKTYKHVLYEDLGSANHPIRQDSEILNLAKDRKKWKEILNQLKT